MNHEIHNLIFDVGGVLLSYRWKELLIQDLGVPAEVADEVGLAAFQSDNWNLFDAGEITMEDVITRSSAEKPQLAVYIRRFLENSQGMRVFRPKVYDAMGRLKEKGFGIYLLSNYSEELFHLHTEGAGFWKYVDGKVVSYQIHKVKPGPEIYKHLLEKYDLTAEECLFFDDRADNVEGAVRVGMQSIQVPTEEALLAELEKLLQGCRD